MSQECARSWEAEAIEDGRLSDAAAESFVRHAAQCTTCSRAQRQLDALRRHTAQLPTLVSTPLELRRQRNELLRRANALVVEPARTPTRRLTLAAAALCAGFALLALMWTRASSPVATRSELDVPTFEVVASREATWRIVERGATLRLAAEQGRLEIAVAKLRPGQRFLLGLPDGDLEVKGTRFVVEIAAHATRSVAVSEGHVMLRIQGEPQRSLRAGDLWSTDHDARAEEPIDASVAAPSSTEAEEATSAANPARASRAAANRSTTARASRRDSDERAVAAPPTPEAGVARAEAVSSSGAGFSAAMSAFSRGDFAQAAELFATFEREHQADARVEDALFLRAVAHARRGDRAQGRTLARAYLERYPTGVHAREAAKLSE